MNEFAQHVEGVIGFKLSKDQLAAFELYERQLLEWNERVNLTAIQEPEMIRTKHFLDSLTCLLVMRETKMEKIIDVGSGAGFPGLPLKIIHPKTQLTLVESVGKKVDFLHHLINRLKLNQVDILLDRAEAVGQNVQYRQKYDWAIARAVAIMPALMEYLLPLVRIGGAVIAMKGEKAPAEVQASEYAIRVLGGHLRKIIPVTLPGVADQRYLVVIDKIAGTPREYPRRIGVPLKKPL